MKKIVVIALKTSLSLALIWYAFSKIDTASALRLIQEIPLAIVAALLAILVAQQLIASLRLQRILSFLGTELRLGAAVDAVFIGVFFGQTFISFIGGDAMRVWRIMTHQITVGRAARAVLLDRVAGFVSLVGLIAAGLPFLFGVVSDPAMRTGIATAVAIGLAATVVFLAMSRMPSALHRWRVARLMADVASQALAIARVPREMFAVLGISLAIQLLNVVAIYIVSLGLGIEARLLDFLVLVPPVLLLAMLPISFAGWGVREGAMVVALGLVGISAEHSVAMSVCFGLALVAIGLPGGILWFAARKPAATPHVG